MACDWPIPPFFLSSLRYDITVKISEFTNHKMVLQKYFRIGIMKKISIDSIDEIKRGFHGLATPYLETI
jgi:hypothetical protein